MFPENVITAGMILKNEAEWKGFIWCSGMYIHCFSSIPKRELNTPQKDTEFNDFVWCSGMYIHCFTTKPTTKSVTLNKGETEYRPDIFSKLLTLQRKLSTNSLSGEILKAELTSCIALKESLACRYMLAKSVVFADDIEYLKSEIKNALLHDASECAKAIAWRIVQLFGRTIKLSLEMFIDIWPGFICKCDSECKTKESVNTCSSEMVIIAEVECTQFDLATTYFGFKIIQTVCNYKSPEAIHIISKLKDIPLTAADCWLKGTESSQAEMLFSLHSKLCILSSSPVKSKGFSRQHKLEKSKCIQFFCKIKGVIPVGESHFPKLVKGVKTDVLEGSSYLLSKTLEIGDDICSKKSQKSGTLGGFVKILDNEAFLTCAHVVVDKDSLLSSTKRRETMKKTIPVFVKTNPNAATAPTYNACGSVRSYVFKKGGGDESGVDAALVNLDDGFKIHDLFNNRDISSCIKGENISLNDNFMDLGEIPSTFHTECRGAVSGFQQKIGHAQSEKESNLEFETLVELYDKFITMFPNTSQICVQEHTRIIMKKIGDSERLSPRTCTMYNQIAFKNIAFELGDSGTCIYIKNPHNEYKCIGMAISTHPAEGCIATPMKAILSSFGLM